MLDFLYGKNRWPIALDIGTDSIKMLQMHRAGGRLAVRACGRWRFPASATQDLTQWRALAIGAVRDILRKGDFRGSRVRSALPSQQLKIKNIRLPNLPEAEQMDAIRWEAKQRFGDDFQPDQLHCIRAGEVRQGAEARDEIIMIAATGETIESHLSLLDEMGLRPEHIDIEPLAMFRPFEQMLRRQADENAISVIVDIGHGGTKVVVARGRTIVLIKSIPIGGRNFAEAVAKQLNLSYEEASDLRIQTIRENAAELRRRMEADSEPESPAVDPNSVGWTVLDAVRGEVENLSHEISLCLRYCSVTFRGLRCQQVTVIGGQAYDAALVQLLSEQLGADCQVGQPLRGVDTSGVDLGGDRRGMLAEWAVCAGLALRGVEAAQTSGKADHDRDRLSA